MTKIMTAAATLLLVAGAAWADVGKEEVKKLIQAGISDDTIVLFIRNHGPVAVLSADDLAELKKLGASDRVLSALLTPQPAKPTVAAPAYTAPSSTPYVYDSGYDPYYYSSYYPYSSSFYAYPSFGFSFFGRPRTFFFPVHRPFSTFGGRGFIGFGGRGFAGHR